MTGLTGSWPDARCNVGGCIAPPVWLDLYQGRRCQTHRPRFSPTVATALVASGWPDTAAAYRRATRAAS